MDVVPMLTLRSRLDRTRSVSMPLKHLARPGQAPVRAAECTSFHPRAVVFSSRIRTRVHVLPRLDLGSAVPLR